MVAVLRDEVEGAAFQAVLAHASQVLIGAPTLLELAVVMRAEGRAAVEELLDAVEAEVVPFTAEHARVASVAYGRFGRGSGSPARLNLGDALSYAVAMVADEPLLFKGEDFVHTDVRRVEPPSP